MAGPACGAAHRRLLRALVADAGSSGLRAPAELGFDPHPGFRRERRNGTRTSWASGCIGKPEPRSGADGPFWSEAASCSRSTRPIMSCSRSLMRRPPCRSRRAAGHQPARSRCGRGGRAPGKAGVDILQPPQDDLDGTYRTAQIRDNGRHRIELREPLDESGAVPSHGPMRPKRLAKILKLEGIGLPAACL